MKKVIVGMSGGVDSAVTALLLKQAGYDVAGVTLRTWEGKDGQDSRCCEIDDARQTAAAIGIPYYAFNCVSDFENKVVKPFVNDYLHGMTPHPCVVCNRDKMGTADLSRKCAESRLCCNRPLCFCGKA